MGREVVSDNACNSIRYSQGGSSTFVSLFKMCPGFVAFPHRSPFAVYNLSARTLRASEDDSYDKCGWLSVGLTWFESCGEASIVPTYGGAKQLLMWIRAVWLESKWRPSPRRIHSVARNYCAHIPRTANSRGREQNISIVSKMPQIRRHLFVSIASSQYDPLTNSFVLNT